MFEKITKWIKRKLDDRKHKKFKEKRLKELRKRDPFIYH
tara:strand:+ start:216 stop:332 length:117 start_codon:yes stop_codon:yes gene_type:complete